MSQARLFWLSVLGGEWSSALVFFETDRVQGLGISMEKNIVEGKNCALTLNPQPGTPSLTS